MASAPSYTYRTYERLSSCFRRSDEELCHNPPRGGTPSEEGDDRLLRGPTGASRLREARGESNPASGLRDQKYDRGTTARGLWGPELIPGRPPKRSGLSHTSRPGAASGLGAEARRGFRRNRTWRRLRDDRSRARSAFEFEPLRRAGSLGLRHSHPSVTVPCRSATWAAPEGQTFSAGQASCCLGVTAEAGFFETVREGGGFRKRRLPSIS